MSKYLFSLCLVLAFTACKKSSNVSEIKVDDTQNTSTDTISNNTKQTIEELSAYFTQKKAGNDFLIQPKAIESNGNGIYLYFTLVGNKAKGLRLHIQYWGENYPEADLYRFNVDGKTTEYIANRDKKGAENSRIAESIIFYWYDNSINQTDLEFLESIAKSTDTRLSLIDRATNKVVSTIQLSNQNKLQIQRTLDYYFAHNGAQIPKKGMVNIRG